MMEFTSRIIMKVKETEEDFIFTSVSGFLNETYRMIIPKKLLVLALNAYQERYPMFYNYLLEEANRRAESEDKE